MINPISIANIKSHLATEMKDKVQQLRSDTQARMEHLQQMRADVQAGDLEGAESERDAARQAQQNVIADHKNLNAFHQDIQKLHQSFVQRHEDVGSLKDAIQRNDLEAAKAAFAAIDQDTASIRSQVDAFRASDTRSASVDFTV